MAAPENRLEFTPKNVEHLWMDYEAMRKRGPAFINAISWMAPDNPSLFSSLAQNPETYSATREVVDLLRAHPKWTFSEYGILRPPSGLRNVYSDPADAINYVHRKLFTRAFIMDKIHAHFGTERFQVTLGNSPAHLECTIDQEIKPSGTRFSLFEGKEYLRRGKPKKIEIGMVDISIASPLMLIVGLIQDHNADDRITVLDPTTGKRKRASSIASNRQSKIRKFMKKGRDILQHSTASETAGVEELALYTAMEIMTEAGALSSSNNTEALIPYPDHTNWGGLEWSLSDGTIYASTGVTGEIIGQSLLSETYQLSLSKLLSSREFEGSQRRSNPAWPGNLGSGLFTMTQRRLQVGENMPTYNINGQEVSLDKITVDCVMGQIPEGLGPSDDWLKHYGYFDQFSNFRDLGFKSADALFRHVTGYLASFTPQYLATFSPYYAAFYDTGGGKDQFRPEGRRISLSQVRELPFASSISIAPITK